MAKKLIVLSDGTGNSAAKLFKTNVWKLYEALDLTPSSDQIALYDDGVGTSRFKPWALLTGAFGFGLKRNVLKMYVFLSRHYDNQMRAGGGVPEIYAFGFSRGAYTVRIASGLINRQGLLKLDHESEMHRLAVWAYRDYRRRSFPAKWHIERCRDLRDFICKTWDQLRGLPAYDDSKKLLGPARTGDSADAGDGRETPATRPITIRFLGVWDTVAAYGMPIEELRVAIDKLIFPLRFTSTGLAENVECARHALAIDEERSSFAPVLWDHEPGKARLQQVWFSGMHSNVGGGYPDDSLSSTPLVWMLEEASNAGLTFDCAARAAIRSRATPFGKMYDSRSGLAMFYRYQPRDLHPGPTGGMTTVHESVIFRMATAFQGYAPITLPDQVCVLQKGGPPLQFGGFQTAARSQSGRFQGIATTATNANMLATMVARLRPPAKEHVALVQDAILLRRFTYFGTLFPMLALVAFPLLTRIFAESPEADAQIDPGALRDIGEALQTVTPAYVAPWLEAFVQHPWWTLVLAVVGIVSFVASKTLKTRIAERARAAWNIGVPPHAMLTKTVLDGTARKLLDSGSANLAWGFTTRKVFPALALGAALILSVASIDRLAFWLRSSGGSICKSAEGAPQPRPLIPAGQDVTLRAADTCKSTGLLLVAGERYRISLRLPGSDEWNDGGLPADTRGIDFAKLGLFDKVTMNIGGLWRRKPWTPWFRVVARIHALGSEEYALTRAQGVNGSGDYRQMTSIVTPRGTGELFLFVNDAYSGLFPLAWMNAEARSASGALVPHLYGNNHGTATVRIERDVGQQRK